MIGRCRVYFDDRHFGFIEYSSSGEIFDESIYFGDSGILPGDFAEFDVERDWAGRTVACNLNRISRDVAPTVVRVWQGRVVIVRGRKSARIDYTDDEGRNKGIWFSFDELQPSEDGLIYEPVPGCLVEFQIAIRRSKRTAANVNIIEWPVHQETIEEYFESAPELEIDVPAPVAAPQSSVLSPANRSIPMIELIRRRREGKLV